MGIFTIKLTDIGEGVAEAELTEWAVKVGDMVREDDILGAVMTDKAAVEIPSTATGRVVWLGAEVGDTVAIGAPIVRIEVEGEGNTAPEDGAPEETAPNAPASGAGKVAEREEAPKPSPKPPAEAPRRSAAAPAPSPARAPAHRAPGARPLAAPSVRLKARELGIDLRLVPGSGPGGRITHDDLAAFAEGGGVAGPTVRAPRTGVTEVRVTGLRRRIAERVSLSATRIPHFSIVEEVDMTELEALRETLNARHADRPRLTFLPFLARAVVAAVTEQPALNAHFDDEAGVVHQHAPVHVGIATQTPQGLVVPVLRHAEALDPWQAADEIARLADAARAGSATREELTGSTITITSLGKLGALATTPIINHPEVAIVGVNRMETRPLWDGSAFRPRRMMNLSCSFDHRVVDGWDAAVFVARLKELIETPALLFVEG
ncbi:dihydrolipoamide acetyltransferase family protein [Futiania mangrovi]|uniref:Dihydrolipoamide acetyltransferase component of pyruvate dehydrogenase complex n=1 Tax=Futiania mangrovi TaxID=2959716 RepID=A0A9J6PCD7_9PROT|nr:dihydrolipoamide acetyltransferase family protein [Futiania mangrovii]MCP1335283.1 2-oxo acid dehydrogenase subunit E2 [Futiania mangrovii]